MHKAENLTLKIYQMIHCRKIIILQKYISRMSRMQLLLFWPIELCDAVLSPCSFYLHGVASIWVRLSIIIFSFRRY
jgi:hypothetical protein